MQVVRSSMPNQEMANTLASQKPGEKQKTFPEMAQQQHQWHGKNWWWR